MLVVWGRKTADPPPPLHGVQGLAAPDQETVERNREGTWVGASEGPLGQVALEGEVHGGGFSFLKEYQGRVHQHQKEAPGGGRGEFMRGGWRGRRRGRRRAGPAGSLASFGSPCWGMRE